MTDRYRTRKNIKIASIVLLLTLLIGYTAYEIQRVALGPRINITSPQNGSLVSDPLAEITGVAQNIKEISLNDRKIFIDEKGNFKEEVLLSYGYNTFTLKATDKFGRETEKIIEVIYK